MNTNDFIDGTISCKCLINECGILNAIEFYDSKVSWSKKYGRPEHPAVIDYWNGYAQVFRDLGYEVESI